MPYQQHDHWRRHAILALLVAAALAGSFLCISNRTEVAHSRQRQLAAKRASRAKHTKRAKPTKLASLADPKTVVLKSVATDAVAAAAGGPNVIYLQHDSLSGNIALNTAEGVKAMPSFQDKMHNDPNFYVFEHSRGPSGNTLDALPTLMTGCLPYTKAAWAWVHERGRSVGYDFRRLGYRTASFSSRALDKTIKTGPWKVLYDLLVGDMEKVVDPISQEWPRDNKEASDDRRMLPEFEKWLAELGEGDPATPFYAQFFSFNAHYPYLKKKGKPKSPHLYYQSLATIDEFLKRLFDVLDRTGRLQNTMIIGSGDHGEEPFIKGFYIRLQALNSNILQPVSYMYYPQQLLPDPSAAARLRGNTQKLVHTLDMYPTIQGLIGRAFALPGGEGGDTFVSPNDAPGGCITGVDLAAVDVPEDRAVISLNLYSGRGKKSGRYWALSTKKLSLYHRKHPTNYWGKNPPGLKQGYDNAYVLKYGDCSHSLCKESVTTKYKEYFRGVIQSIKTSPMYDEGVKTSELVVFFSKMVGWKETA